MQVLAADDEPKIADYLLKGLTENGYVVDVANSGVDGARLALAGDYDPIVLDITMPGWMDSRSCRNCDGKKHSSADSLGARNRGKFWRRRSSLIQPGFLFKQTARARRPASLRAYCPEGDLEDIAARYCNLTLL
jgi:hypothetical protein